MPRRRDGGKAGSEAGSEGPTLGCGGHGCLLRAAAVTVAPGSGATVYRLVRRRGKRDGDKGDKGDKGGWSGWSGVSHSRVPAGAAAALWEAAVRANPGLAVKHIQSRRLLLAAVLDRDAEFMSEVDAVRRLAVATDARFMSAHTTMPLISLGKLVDAVGIVIDDGATPDGYTGKLLLVFQTACEGTALQVVPAMGKAGVLKMAADVLESLSHLQAFGLIHSDLKADNIVACGPPRRRRFKLIDWGDLQVAASTLRPSATKLTNNPMALAVSSHPATRLWYGSDFMVKRLQRKRGIRPTGSDAATVDYLSWLDGLTARVYALTEHSLVGSTPGAPLLMDAEARDIVRLNADKFDLFGLGVALLQVMSERERADAELRALVEGLMLPRPALCEASGWRGAAEARRSLPKGAAK